MFLQLEVLLQQYLLVLLHLQQGTPHALLLMLCRGGCFCLSFAKLAELSALVAGRLVRLYFVLAELGDAPFTAEQSLLAGLHVGFTLFGRHVGQAPLACDHPIRTTASVLLHLSDFYTLPTANQLANCLPYFAQSLLMLS